MKTHLTVREGRRSGRGDRDGDRALWLLAASGHRDTETERVITRGQLETQEQGRARGPPPAGHTARNMSRGVCDSVHLLSRGTSERKKERKRRGRGEGACEGIRGL